MKHIVRVCRPRFEVLVLKVEADDDDTAIEKALGEAERLPADAWHLQSLDPSAYRAHVETCYSEHTIEANVGVDDAVKAEFEAELLSPNQDEETRYCLLLGDVGSGEGKVLFQPWFRAEDPQLLEHDIAGDWIERLQAVMEEGWENFEEEATAAAPDTKVPIIVPPRPRGPKK